jgi:hypothetical protein
MSTGRLSRRDFLAGGGGAAAAALAGASGLRAAEPEPGAVSRVVLVRRGELLSGDGQPGPEVLRRMLNDAVAALFDAEPAAAWRRLVAPGDVVGIKSNAWRHLPTPPALEEAIRSEVIAAGVMPENVAVDDRGVRENPVFLRATAIINARPMRTHHWSGLGTCIKNMIMVVPRPQEYHGDACASLGAIWHLPEVEGKVRLNVLVMLTPQFHGVGPHSFSQDFVWPYGGLVVGVDPVAVDATGARIIEAKRRLHFGADRPITPPPHHIRLAGERYGLGVSDPGRIELVRLGPMEDALI